MVHACVAGSGICLLPAEIDRLTSNTLTFPDGAQLATNLEVRTRTQDIALADSVGLGANCSEHPTNEGALFIRQ